VLDNVTTLISSSVSKSRWNSVSFVFALSVLLVQYVACQIQEGRNVLRYFRKLLKNPHFSKINSQDSKESYGKVQSPRPNKRRM